MRAIQLIDWTLKRKMATGFVLATCFLFPAAEPTVCGGPLTSSIIGSFPKNISELAYSDFAHARQFPWFAQFKSQTLPVGFGDLEHFLSSAGINPKQQIDEIVWSLGYSDDQTDEPVNERHVSGSPNSTTVSTNAPRVNPHHKSPASDELLAMALGQFDPEASEAFLEKSKTLSISWRGHTLYACGPTCHDFYLVFLDSGTVAFGKASLLEHMLEVRSGAEESILSNKVLSPLIRDVNGGGLFWGVLDDAGTRQALLELIPESGKFPDVSKLISRMQAMTITVDGENELDAEVNVSADPEDAVNLTQLMQAGLLLRQFQAGKDDPQFAKILQDVTITPGGRGTRISLGVSSEQMISLIQHNTFSPKI